MNAIRALPIAEDIDIIDGIAVANTWATRAQLAPLHAEARDRSDYRRRLMAARLIDPGRAALLDELLAEQDRLPEFRLLRRLGAGGMGVVYQARHRPTGEVVALKVLAHRLAGNAAFVERFHREAEALAALRHPHLATVVDAGGEGDVHYLAVEFIDGPSLADLIKRHQALPEDFVLRILRQVATALDYVGDRASLVHRDVKPANILVQRASTATEPFASDAQAKLIDFGLAKATDDDRRLTREGMTLGTPLYMSPEQVRGERLDCRSDIYAIGATAFHLLTGAPPFPGTAASAIMSAHLSQPIPDPAIPVPGLSALTRQLIITCLGKRAEERYPGYRELIAALDACSAGLAQRAGSGPRLLRKPLVVTTGIKRKPEPGAAVSERIARAHSAQRESSASTAPMPQSQPALERSVSGSGTFAPDDDLPPLASSPPSASSAEHASEALRRDHSQRLAEKAAPKTDVFAALDQSKHAPGMGMLPWLALSAALGAAAMYVVLKAF